MIKVYMNEFLLTHPSVIKSAAFLAIESRLARSFLRKLCPRFVMIFLTSVISYISSIFGDEIVIKHIKSSHEELIDVIGLPLSLMTLIADLIVLISSWIVTTRDGTERGNSMTFCQIYKLLTSRFL
jgi:hypothetical protein